MTSSSDDGRLHDAVGSFSRSDSATLEVFFSETEALELLVDSGAMTLTLNFYAEPLGGGNARPSDRTARIAVLSRLLRAADSSIGEREAATIATTLVGTRGERAVTAGAEWRSNLWDNTSGSNLAVSASISMRQDEMASLMIKALPHVSGWRLIVSGRGEALLRTAASAWPTAVVSWGTTHSRTRRLASMDIHDLIPELRREVQPESVVALLSRDAESLAARRLAIGWHFFPPEFVANEAANREEAPLGRTIEAVNDAGRVAVFVTSEEGRTGKAFRAAVEQRVGARLSQAY